MPLAAANRQTRLALQAIREIDQRAKGQFAEMARKRAKGETSENLGDSLANAIRVAYAPVVALAPPPTVAMLNAFMKKVDWDYIVESILIRPELN